MRACDNRSPAFPLAAFPSWLYGVVFVMVAVAAYGWKLHVSQSLKDTAPAQATAKVCIQRPNFASQQAWQEVAFPGQGRGPPELLHVETQSAGQQTTVAISLSNLPAESVVLDREYRGFGLLGLACRADSKVTWKGQLRCHKRKHNLPRASFLRRKPVWTCSAISGSIRLMETNLSSCERSRQAPRIRAGPRFDPPPDGA